MAELKRTVKCSNCSSESNIYLASDMSLSEVLLHGRCSRCGNSLQLNYTLIENAQQSNKQGTQTAENSLPNLDETLFEPELPSDSIKDLIED